jgi:hypothetical protein
MGRHVRRERLMVRGVGYRYGRAPILLAPCDATDRARPAESSQRRRLGLAWLRGERANLTPRACWGIDGGCRACGARASDLSREFVGS